MISHEQALRSAVPNFLLHLALRAPAESHEASLLWDLPVTRVIASEDETLVDFAPPARGLLIDRRTIDFRLQDDSTHSWLALAATAAAAVPAASRFARLSSGAQLSLIDTNPLATLEEHPDKQGNAVDLGGQDLGAWRDRLESAFSVIQRTLPTLFGEMSTTIDRIVPVGVDPHRHFSASYREAPGLMYLSLHPSTLTMAEAIVHESQHSKLNAVSWFDAVLENGRTAWTKSPVRPDLRPLMGVLLAVHAFVPVAAMHLRLAELEHPLALDAGFAQRRAQVLAANADGLNTLRELAKPTTLGSKVLGALFELHAAVLAASPALSPRPPGTGGQRLEELG